MEFEGSYKRLTTSVPSRFDVAQSDLSQLNAAEIVFDYKSGIAKKILRINFIDEVKKC